MDRSGHNGESTKEEEPRPPTLLTGVEAAITAKLGISSLRHKSALIALSSAAAIPNGSVDAAFEGISANWAKCVAATGGGHSSQNWRWRVPQLAIADRNASPEVMLERGLVQACERLGLNGWANQVPVASGIAGPTKERRRAIDLVHHIADQSFEFIELKIASDNALFAAFEIVQYSCIWLLARQHAGSAAVDLLGARRIDAVVWAPDSFYAGLDLTHLAMTIDRELALLGARNSVTLGFRFDAFPDALATPPYTDERIVALLAARRSL